MKAMILAAGQGARMGALCHDTPKVLLPVKGLSLVQHHVQQLKHAGITDIIINVWHLAQRIKTHLGDGSQFGVNIHYSDEVEPLETGGGILKALPLLGDDPFIVVSGDLWTPFPFANLPKHLSGLAHIVLNDTLALNPTGDFTLNGALISNYGTNKLNFAGIGVYHPGLFKGCKPGKFKMAPLIRTAATRGLVNGEYYSGPWFNVSKPEIYHRIK